MSGPAAWESANNGAQRSANAQCQLDLNACSNLFDTDTHKLSGCCTRAECASRRMEEAGETTPTLTAATHRWHGLTGMSILPEFLTRRSFPMKAAAIFGSAIVLFASAALADSPDSSFYKNAAEGGLSEVELGQLAQDKAADPAVKNFGAMMVKDHSAANEKLKALAASKQVSLPSSPSVMQKASKTKLNMMSGESFDKSYIKGMVDDHKKDIKEFQEEASNGKDPDARAFAASTLPVLQTHLQKIQAIATAAGIKD
jgi:putative membrane protein